MRALYRSSVPACAKRLRLIGYSLTPAPADSTAAEDGVILYTKVNTETPARELIERLADEFDVDLKELEPDILAFFEELLSAGLIVRTPMKAIHPERCCER